MTQVLLDSMQKAAGSRRYRTQGACGTWSARSRELQFTPERIDRMAEFVADFSLAGIRALVQNKKGCEGVLGTLTAR